MSAAYPLAVKSFTPIVAGVSYPQATQVNQAYDEIEAVEGGLVNGFAHALVPDATANDRDLGSASKAWGTLYVGAISGPANPQVCQGRLTLTTATPVTSTDVTGAGTLYFTPYGGNLLALYDGSTSWVFQSFTERSLVLSVTSGKNYDVFIYDNSGTITLETVEWTSDTVRATALALQNGVLVKTGATTRRYLGTIRASGSNTTEDSLAKRFVWNYYNRMARPLRVLEATNSWPYTTATLRQANAAVANQLDLVVGVAEDALSVQVLAIGVNSSANETVVTAIGEDSTSAAATGSTIASGNSVADIRIMMTASLVKVPAIGRHFYAWLEYSTASGTTTWYGDNNTPTIMQSGIFGMWRA